MSMTKRARGGGSLSGTLQGCTGGTVTVQKGDHIYTYNDKGQIISVRNVK